MAPSIWAKLVALTRWIACYLTPWRRPTPHEVRLRVDTVIEHMRNGRWTELKHEFILPLRPVPPESVLEKGWKIVRNTFGHYESADDPIITRAWGFTTVKVPLNFQNGPFGMLLQMTPGGSLVGFRLLSRSALGLGTGWKKPPYADERAHEVEMTLGKGELEVGGTLCLPHTTTATTQFPCVVFLAGSGPCDRDSTIEENKPLKDLALGLASRGIASLRFDKVTFTHAKAMQKRKNMTLTDEYVEHAVDAVLQARQHPNIISEKVFILGHSLGAVVAPMVATMDEELAGCIIMAGPAEPIYRCYIRQLEYIKSLDGPEAPYIEKQIDQAREQADLADSDRLTMSTPARKLPFGIGPAYWLDYRRFQPIERSSSLGKPMLVMQGDRDYQVGVKDDYEQWYQGLQDQSNVQLRLYDGLNHLFVFGRRPSAPLEYAIPGNVDERILVDLAEWVSGL